MLSLFQSMNDRLGALCRTNSVWLRFHDFIGWEQGYEAGQDIEPLSEEWLNDLLLLSVNIEDGTLGEDETADWERKVRQMQTLGDNPEAWDDHEEDGWH